MIRRLKILIYRRLGFNVAFISLCFFIALTLLAYRSWNDVQTRRTHYEPKSLDLSITDCDTINVMSVVGGNNATFGFSVLLKSLLAVRHNPLMLHLLVDEDSEIVLSEMLDTWLVSGLTYKFYQIKHYKRFVSWIPNAHYSGTYGLLKLLVPHILVGIEKVIVLDTDLLFMDDILPIWKAFIGMQANGKFFGLVENQSDWYLKVTASSHESEDDRTRTFKMPWPALGRGFNSGMMLMNLAALKQSGMDWMSLWKEVTVRQLKTYEVTALADQDIFNAVFAENPNLVMKLPCDWNLQLSYGAKEAHCLNNLTSLFRVVHFNHPEKTTLLFEYGDSSDFDGLFANVYSRAVETNGYHFRSLFAACRGLESQSEISQKGIDDLSPGDACYDIRLETVRVRRTFPLFFSGRLGKGQDEEHTGNVGIATHLSFDRIGQLELICRNWNGEGAISAAVYLNDADIVSLVRLILDYSSCLATGRVHIHLVFRHGVTYPVNLLRNVALKFAKDTHVLILDADFIPSSDFSKQIDYSLLSKSKVERIALVVPAFDISSFVDLSVAKEGTKIDKLALLDYIDRGLAQPFQSIKWPAGHAPTNFSRWRTASAPYQVHWAPDYEPYLVIRINRSINEGNVFEPRFDERFVGFGWNKVSYAMQLDALGYKFMVDPLIFVVHLPHLPSVDLMRFRANPLYQTCLENFKLEFVNELASHHGATALKYLKAMPTNSNG